MNAEGHSDHQVKRVVLPSGKTIEVVYFENGETASRADGVPAHLADSPSRDLHVCHSCESKLVYPTHWEEAGPRHWHVALRCPNCEWTADGVYCQDTVEAFDEELDRGTDALTSDLRRLMRANMAEEIDRFVSALEADAVLPMDF